MEEILASIRRIIADDQTLPNRDAPPPAPASVAPPVPSAELHGPGPTPNVVALEQRSVPPVPFPPEPPAAVAPEPPVAHGPVTAPQFPSHGAYAEPEPERVADYSGGLVEPESWDEPPVAHEPEPLTASLPEAPADDEVYESFAPEEAPHPAGGPVTSGAVAGHPAEIADHGDIGDEIVGTDDRDPPLPEPGATALFSPATDSAVSSAFNMLAASRLADNSDELMNLAREMIRPLLRTWIDDNLPSMVERMVRAEIERVARGGR